MLGRRTSTNGKGTPGAAATDVRRPSLEQGLPPWAPKSTTTALASSSSSRGRRTSFSGGPPAWAPQHQQGGDSPLAEQLKARADESPEGRRPGLAGGMPSWAPADKKVAAGSDGSSRRRRRSSLGGGMPAWAPAGPGGSPTRSRRQEEDELPVPEPEQATPALPDWLTAAAGGGSAQKEADGTALDDEARTEWTAACESSGNTDAACNNVSSGHSGGSEGLDWLSAAAVVRRPQMKSRTAISTNLVASESRAQQRNSASSVPSSLSKITSSTAPGSWLALSIASGNLGGLSDDGESHLAGDRTNNGGDTGKEDTATQTDDVVIVEASTTVSEQTTSKNSTKSKLPPWAKPWSKPSAPAVAGPDSTSPSSIDNRQAPNVGEDKATDAGGSSSGGGGGLDWISAAVDNGVRTA
ncbi:unnamed protein product [Ectocarpus sp. CCAP 1310/34]|nr:unnamed protein product [Ectocarpus sp. CCAP 1310/34]